MLGLGFQSSLEALSQWVLGLVQKWFHICFGSFFLCFSVPFLFVSLNMLFVMTSAVV